VIALVSPAWSVRKRVQIVIAIFLAIPVVVVFGGAALILGFVFVWFNEGLFFSGDGKYQRGVDGAAFQVEFPAVDLSRPGRYTFNFTRLAPPMGYAVGVRVFDGRRDLPSEARPSAVVSMTLRNERGELVFQQKRRLSEWDWRRNMAVIRGQTDEVPIGGGSVRIENRGVGPDGGWGTYFTPRWSGRYTLAVEVLEADPAAARLLAHPVIEGYMAWF